MDGSTACVLRPNYPGYRRPRPPDRGPSSLSYNNAKRSFVELRRLALSRKKVCGKKYTCLDVILILCSICVIMLHVFTEFLTYLLFDITVIRVNYIATSDSGTCKAIKAELTFCKRCDSMRVPFAACCSILLILRI